MAIWLKGCGYSRRTMKKLAIATTDSSFDEPMAVLAEARWTDLPAILASELTGSAVRRSARQAASLAIAEAVERRAMFTLHQWSPSEIPASSTGWAAGEDSLDAWRRASLEVLERVAYCGFLRGEVGLLEMATDALDEWRLSRYRLVAELYRAVEPRSVAVVVCHLTDPTGRGPRSSVGVAADFDEGSAARSALLEAMKARMWAYQLDRRSAPTDDWTKPVERLMYFAGARSSDRCSALFRQAVVGRSRLEIDRDAVTDPDHRIRAAGSQLECTLVTHDLPESLQRELPVSCPLAFVMSDASTIAPVSVTLDGELLPNPHA